MGTTWAEIITDYAMVEIDDVRLSDELAIDTALFFRRMALYLRNAIPFFTCPPQMADRLSYTAPQWEDAEWTSPGGDNQQADIGLTGFELMSAVKKTVRCDGTVDFESFSDAVYDKATGIVTFPSTVEEGTVFSLDFYTDGVFANELNETEKRILGLCTALVWTQRFSTNWLNLQPKVQDQSFSVGNEANHMRATTDRVAQLRAQVSAEIRKYEQDSAYRNTVLRKGKGRLFDI